MMTRKHFKAFAAMIARLEDEEARMRFAEGAAKVFKDSNPRFSRALFMEACGVEVSR